MACDFSRERALHARGIFLVAGVDEAGRGPLAGPVVAAAVILPEDCAIEGLNDSKKLTAKKREHFHTILTLRADIHWGIGQADVGEIDSLNILRATHLAMARAVAALPRKPDHALVDGLPVRGLPVPHTALVAGDSLMTALDAEYPQYGFARHKGYGVREHLEALRSHGPSPVHRRSFQPVAQTQFAV
jgi:ribonuclease HII